MRDVFPVTVALPLTIALACGCAARTEIENSRPGELSRTLGPSIYYEEGKLMFLGVNSGIARLAKEQVLLPLEVAIANKSLENLTVTNEAFTLRSGEESWPAAPASARAGHTLAADVARRAQPLSFPVLIEQRFPHYREVPPNVGGSPRDRTLARRVEMDRYTWILLQLWFERPAGSLEERSFELWFAAPELPDPVFTTFEF